MIHQVYIPHPALREFINFIGVMHLQVNDGVEPVICPFPPTPQHCMIFYLDDKVLTQKEGGKDFRTYPRAIIVGPQVTRVNIMVRKSHKAVMVAFQPGGLFRLLGVPMHELFDDGYDATEIAGNEIGAVVEELRQAKTYDELKEITETYFLKKSAKLRQILPFDLALKELLQHNGNVAIEKIASRSCLSLRQFERKCQERIGLPPRFFARVARFSKAYRMREQYQDISWTAIAHECGYFDQMHMIRDFKQFAGVTPRIIEEIIPGSEFRMQARLIL